MLIYEDYALLAANVYGNSYAVRTPVNTLRVPGGWTALPAPIGRWTAGEGGGVVDESTGFMASSYRNGNEIVIAYAGTTEGALDWITGNIPAATAAYFPRQVLQAAEFYLDVLRENPDAEISFTGHSLGGGLASLMAVFFDEPAVVFDEAPFLKSADSRVIVNQLRNALVADGYALPTALSSYITSVDPTGSAFPSPSRWAREDNVQQIYVTGEALSLLPEALTNLLAIALGGASSPLGIAGLGIDKIIGPAAIELNPNAQDLFGWGEFSGYDVPLVSGDPVDLHSISLLTGFLLSNEFLVTAQNHPELLPRLFAGLYQNNPTLNTPGLLDLLVQREALGEGALDTLASDVDKINLNAGLTSVQQFTNSSGQPEEFYVSAALVDVVLAGLYNQAKDRPPSTSEADFDTVLQTTSGGLTFDMRSLADEAGRVVPGLSRLLHYAAGQSLFPDTARAAQARWTIQSGAAALSYSAPADEREDIVIGYTANDTIQGGGGNDLLIGNGGDDHLSGGSGADTLVGGAGNDTYSFSSGDGSDTIVDADGFGSITFDGIQITGGKSTGGGSWISDDRAFTYFLVSSVGGRTDLIIRSTASGDRIRIENFQSGQLGIALDSAPATLPPQTTLTILGDLQPVDFDPPNESYQFDNLGNIIVDPDSPAPDRNDLLNGSAGADLIQAGGGRDGVFSNEGDDIIEAGSGIDLARSGAGADRLFAQIQINLELALAQGETALGSGLRGDLLAGGTGDDVLVGSTGDDFLMGERDADVIIAGAGDDNILGGFELGSCSISWTVSREVISTGYVMRLIGGELLAVPLNEDLVGDIVYGGAGNDWMFLGWGDDFADGGADDDLAFGRLGRDTLLGGEGNDYLYGDFVATGETISGAYHASDTLYGGAGNDQLLGNGGSDSVFGEADNDVLRGDDGSTPGQYHGADYLDGGTGDDQISGDGGADILIGGAGNDSLWGDDPPVDAQYLGDDYLDGGDGNDSMQGGGGADTLLGGDGNDLLIGDGGDYDVSTHGADHLDGQAGDDRLWGGGGNDALSGGEGQDLLVGESGNDLLDGGNGNDELEGRDGDDALYGGSGDDRLFGLAGRDALFGQDDDDILAGGDDNDTVSGGRGNDLMAGELGDDALFGDEGEDELQGGDGNDNLDGGLGDDLLFGEAGADTLSGGLGSDQLQGGDADDFLLGRAGNDTLFGDAGNDTLSGDEGSDLLFGGTGNDVLDGGAGNDELWGNAGLDAYVFGRGYGHDVIFGVEDIGVATDVLQFTADIKPADLDVRRDGYDLTLTIRDTGDAVTIRSYYYVAGGARPYGVNEIKFADGTIWYTLASGISNLPYPTTRGSTGPEYIGGTRVDALGGDDHISLTANASVVFGRGYGNDAVVSAGGGYTVLVNTDTEPSEITTTRVNDDLVLAINGSTDSLTLAGYFINPDRESRVINFLADGTSWDFSPFVRLTGTTGSDTLVGGTGNDVLVGNAGDDVLIGGEGVDDLYGGVGADTLDGGLGDDNLSADSNDTIVFGRGSGRDQLDSVDVAIQITADVLPSDLTLSRDGNRLCVGIAGSTDQLNIPLFFWRDSSPTRVNEIRFASDGTVWTLEQIRAPFLVGTNGNDDLEGFETNDEISGLAGDDTLAGEYGNDILAGGAGNDLLYGWYGDDTYLFNLGDGVDDISEWYSGNDSLIFGPGIAPSQVRVYRDQVDGDLRLSIQGTGDGVSIDRYFYSSSNVVEQIRFADGTVWNYTTVVGLAQGPTEGTDTLHGSYSEDYINGLGGNDTIYGYSGDDRLDGGAGADTFLGQIGDDTYVIDNSGDAVIEGAGEGADTVESSVSYALPDHVEHLTLVGSNAVNATGNSLNNTLTGNLGANVLSGGSGDDTYVVGAGDTVVENTGGGIDTVFSSVTFTLGANVENLSLDSDSADNGTGNALSNVLTGNIAANVLDGGTGADTLIGQSGNDTYIVDNTADTIVETANEGIDLVQSSVTYTLSDNVENLTLTGTSAINGTGNAFNNVLTGNSGNNALTGGMGDDTYVVTGGDTIIENAEEGVDSVQSAATYTLGANVENLTLTGTGKINGTGNALNNALTGNTANNTLNGGAGDDRLSGGGGTDTLVGGTGNDTYLVVAAGATITENANEGADTVESTITYVLGANVEHLTLTGAAAINGTGNALSNVLTGNIAANVLDGGTGADTLIGQSGNDTYIVDNTADTIVETANEGIDLVQSSVTYTLSDNVENLTLTGTSAINGTGNAFNNVLTGNSGNNALTGGMGDDTYVVTGGDTIIENAEEGVDSVQSAATYTLGANVENLTLTGTSAINGTGNAFNNVLTGNSGNNVLTGGMGDDTYVATAGDTIIENAEEGVDSVQSAATYTLGANVENLTLTGTSAINGTGNALNNVLTGNSGNNVLTGGMGDDTYVATAGDTIIENANEGADTVDSVITYTLGANVENLTLTGTSAINGTGNALDNVLTGNSAANVLDGGAGADALIGGAGDDVYVVENAQDVIVEEIAGGIDTVQTASNYIITGNIENVTLIGMAAADATGNTGHNALTGNSAANTLTGGAGNDTLNGVGGLDTLIGGTGEDTYIVNTAGASIVEGANEGTDTVISTLATYTLADHIENLTLGATSAINGTGNALNNTLTGNSAANILDGGLGSDTLRGGAGDDTYIVDSQDIVVENSAEGTDTVQSAFNYALGSNVENLTLTGSSTASGTGNSLNNVITGNAAANSLNGGIGADTLIGGAGNDTYVVDNAGDTATENAGEGTDTVQSSLSHALGTNVENLTLTGSSAINGTGNGLNNVLTGNSGNNLLTGGLGDDTYVVTAGDTVIENINEGVDTVRSESTYALGANVENLTLAGFASINGTGNALNNVLAGNSGSNVLTGRAGDDTYIIGSSDTVVENANEGTDTVQCSVTHVLGANVENLVLTGTNAVNGTGNVLNNVLTGNSAANVLDGGAGADTMRGGAGSDTYVVDAAGDSIQENSSEGVDTVRSYLTYVLGANLENLVLLGTAAINSTGNELDNVLTGNSVANTLMGGAGNDTYVIGAGDTVVENAGEGIDTVESDLTYSLGANLENLRLIGTAAINATGNALNNVLAGNSAANALTGGLGDDTYVIGWGDAIIENSGEGIDTVEASFTYTLGANVENLELTATADIDGTGNALSNVLTGNGGANTLDGAAGADTMRGGAGDDIYIVNEAGDVAIENASEGNDTIRSAVTCALSDNVENLTLTGTAAINATGNALNNVFTGNSAANVLAGGAGDDTYIVNAGDTIIENTGEGIDTVQNDESYVLGSNLENLTLSGTGAINGTGNELDNVLTGNSGANLLFGGTGDDTYVVSNGDIAVENAGEGTDTVHSALDYTLGENIENLMLTGAAASNGTGNALNNVLTGNSAANVLAGGVGNDTYVLGAGDTVVEVVSGGIDTVHSSISYTLGSYVENLVLSGVAAINGSGNTLDNVLTGNSASNTLDGRVGVDTMAGGLGNDTYVVDNIDDHIVESAGEGIDTVEAWADIILAPNVENVNVLGVGAYSVTGNSLDNSLVGNHASNYLVGDAGNDTLSGGRGADTLAGGIGDDAYDVDNPNDIVTELVNEGQDTVTSSVNHALAANVEHLVLTGMGALVGTGNSLVNTITGSNADNQLDGGLGADTLIGGIGDDTYRVDEAGDVVIENSEEGIDTVRSLAAYHQLSVNVENLALEGMSAVHGVGNNANNAIYGNALDNVLDGGADGYDRLYGGTGSDTYIANVGLDYRIEDSEGAADILQFGEGISAAQLAFSRDDYDLLVTLLNFGGKVRIANWYLGEQWRIESIRLAEGSEIQVPSMAGALAAGEQIDTSAALTDSLSVSGAGPLESGGSQYSTALDRFFAGSERIGRAMSPSTGSIVPSHVQITEHIGMSAADAASAIVGWTMPSHWQTTDFAIRSHLREHDILGGESELTSWSQVSGETGGAGMLTDGSGATHQPLRDFRERGASHRHGSHFRRFLD